MTRQPPTISVVIPALNAAATLAEQLDALAGQAFSKPWEIVVVDNGSTDDTSAVANAAGCHRLCSLSVVHEPRRGLNVARNTGIRACSAARIAICDADDVVSDGWLAAMFDGLDSTDIVGGAMAYGEVNPPEAAAMRGWSDESAPSSSIGYELGFLEQIIGANVAFRRVVWEATGGFDEAFTHGGDDVDFGWRAQLAGFTVGYRPDAVLHYRARPDRRALYRQYVRDGEGAAHLYSIHRRSGMPRRPYWAAIRTCGWLARHLPVLVRGDLSSQGHFIRVAGKQWGRLKGSVRLHVIFL